MVLRIHGIYDMYTHLVRPLSLLGVEGGPHPVGVVAKLHRERGWFERDLDWHNPVYLLLHRLQWSYEYVYVP